MSVKLLASSFHSLLIVVTSGQNPEDIPKIVAPRATQGFVGHKTGHTARGCAGTISYIIGNTKKYATCMPMIILNNRYITLGHLLQDSDYDVLSSVQPRLSFQLVGYLDSRQR